MTAPSAQVLRQLPGRFVAQHLPGDQIPSAHEEDWLALVRAPDGLTVIRRVETTRDNTWVALYSGDTAHAPDATGMLSAIVHPLAQANLPVLVASTSQADVVLVPEDRRALAVETLRHAGHQVHT